MGDDKYQLCPCGSGRKLKFCCYETLGQSSNAELFRRASEFAVHESRVSANWQTAGLAEVLVVRRATNLKYVVGVYLVDDFCLGLKNTLARATFNYEDIQAMERGFHRMKEISYEDARSIILGAVEYARRLGFEPHEDWTLSGPIVEAGKPYKKKFTFGKDGKPFYIQRPHDDVRKTMEKLGPLIKEKKAGYVCVTRPIFDDDLAGDGTEASFDERCDRVEQDLKDGVL